MSKLLTFPRVFWLVAFLAVALALPSVPADFYCDDQPMVLRLEGVAPPSAQGPLDLYTFATGEPGEQRSLVEHWSFPWWTVDGLRLKFLRPLSSALIALDHAVAGRHPLSYHLHSVAWYVVAVLVAAALLRRLLPEREAALAALVFCASSAHWMVAAWPSARHVAVSGAFALAALGLHLRAREAVGRGGKPLLVGALALGTLGLAGGETALGLFAYVAAYEAFGRTDAVADRVRALTPWGALLAVYVVVYRVLGCGARGSGAYVDPIAQPLVYLYSLPSRLAVFAEAALVGVPSELSTLAPRAIPFLVALGVAATLALALLLRRARRSLDPAVARTHLWLFVGAGAAVLPGAAGIPGDRVLFLPDVGVAAAIATVLLRAGKAGGQGRGLLPARVAVGFFALVHVVLMPVTFAFAGGQLASSSRAALRIASQAEIPAREGVTVAGIGLSDPLVGMYLSSSLRLAPRSEPRPRALHLLTMSPHDERVRRVADRTLEITVVDGALLDSAFEYLLRSRSAPLYAGDVLPLGAWSVACLDDDGLGRPTRIAVTFDRSVDDPTLALIVWADGALRALPHLAIGEETLVEHAVGPLGM